jgi:hypothetical protein
MRILVCGGRDFDDYDLFERVLTETLNQKAAGQEVEFISGGARGADRMIIQKAKVWNKPCQVFMAKWNQLGNMAGYVRNKQMLVEGKPDLVIAFPGGKGTAMMVRIAKDAGVEVVEV